MGNLAKASRDAWLGTPLDEDKGLRSYKTMRIRRLTWAGIEIECAGSTLVIDLLQHTSRTRSMRDWVGLPGPSRPGRTAVALVTHLHADHADPVSLAAALEPGGLVLRPAPATGTPDENVWTTAAESAFIEQNLRCQIMREWEELHAGPFRIAATPAVDGLGDPQVNWVIEAEGFRIFHGGDTMFHGAWWRIAKRYGPFDVAFLPVNGAIVNFPHLQPASPLPAAMTPREAAVASRILGAGLTVPMHYGLHNPPAYIEVNDPLGDFESEAKIAGIAIRVLASGESFKLEKAVQEAHRD